MNESQNFQQVRIIYTATRVETLKRNIFFFKRAVSLKKDHLRREHPLLRRGGGKSIIKSPSATRNEAWSVSFSLESGRESLQDGSMSVGDLVFISVFSAALQRKPAERQNIFYLLQFVTKCV